MAKLKLTKQQKEVFTYLNDLRDSGVTNMYGATPYIMSNFQLDREEASALLADWMGNFDPKGYEDCEIIK